MTKKFIIAGGGTGGHIFPAIAIAQALGKMLPDTDFLFVGAKGKMEMEKIPQAGFKIIGLDIAGFNRSALWKNIFLPFKIINSLITARRIIRSFKPDAVIGVGGYSTYPVLRAAQSKGVPTFIHEANSFAGKANQMLAAKAIKIFTGTDGMEKFFPASKIIVTGNPVRSSIYTTTISKEDALSSFGLSNEKKTILIVGGSLGARSINQAISAGLDKLLNTNLQIIWQTGKLYNEQAQVSVANKLGVWMNDFISDMAGAYAAADIIVSRSGAMSVAEISLIGKPVIFIPYPFAAEDHQRVNAEHLVKKEAALMISDKEAADSLVNRITELAGNTELQNRLKNNIKQFAIADADQRVANEIIASISK
jgi:UDP-N-acetylglucosamine--N-acetylmuramyl-(pentapeptide) pyrophosphoryl-undecaprenol N-acetylglucosamine transferase